MRSSEVLDLLVEVERRFPVTEWTYDGIRIWPLLRVRMYTDILNFRLVERAPARGLERIVALAGRMLKTQSRVAKARIRDARSNASPRRRVEALFFSDGVSFVRIGRNWHDKVFSPLIAWLGRQGGSYLTLTPMSHAHHPRFAPSMFVQPRLDIINAVASLSRGARRSHEFSEIGAALAILARNGVRAALPDEAGILVLCRRLRLLAGYFDGILARTLPRRAFVNTYYSLEGMAFVLACHRRGIRVADIQHGIQGHNHVAYGRWSRTPADGYELLPHEFWVWGREEAGAIDEWRPSAGHMHLPVETGNMWLKIWKNASENFVEPEIARARGLLRGGAGKHVLVTFQWGLARQEEEKILRAVRMSPADWRWWLRLHPLVAHERGSFKSMLRGFGLENVEVDLPTDLPLHALLTIADAHVTHSSSTVVEAAEFGVPSIVTSDYGAEFFAEQTTTGWVRVARTDSEIAQALLALPQASRRSSAETHRDDVDRAMRMAFADVGSGT